ncbi:MAG: phosphoglycerate dehydrogenase [Clostridia bacterium]
MPKVLITARPLGRVSTKPLARLKEYGCDIVPNPYHGTTLNEEQMLELVPGVDGMIVGDDEITGRVIRAAGSLKVISKHGVGTDRIDLAAATQCGVVVTNVPGANKDSVADFTFCLILALMRGLHLLHDRIRGGEWRSQTGHELRGKTLGVVGVGRIGKCVVARGAGFGMKILGYDMVRDEEFARSYNLRYVSLDELLRASDVVTLHVPLTGQTGSLLGDRELAMMKSTAYLVNTARGGVVDEDALYAALKSGRIAGAALDVFAQEPPTESPLLSLPNVIATPHAASHTYEAIEVVGLTAAENLIDVLDGRRPRSVVNPEVYGGTGS